MIPISNLNPQIKIDNEILTVSTAELAAISITDLGTKIDNIESYRSQIINSLDFMITGF